MKAYIDDENEGRKNSRPQLSDVIRDGHFTYYRNPPDRPFAERDVYRIESSWRDPSELDRIHTNTAAKDCEFAQTHPYAWTPDFGYLSPIPEHCGVNLAITASFHLEGLNLIGELEPTLNALTAMRIGADSYTMDDINNVAHIYRLYNNSCIGITEDELVRRVKRIYCEILKQELAARMRLRNELHRVFEDCIMRSLAVLRNCRLLSAGEYLDLLSPLRLASQFGMIQGIDHCDLERAIVRGLLRPQDPTPQTIEEEEERDVLDSRRADRANRRFASVKIIF